MSLRMSAIIGLASLGLLLAGCQPGGQVTRHDQGGAAANKPKAPDVGAPTVEKANAAAEAGEKPIEGDGEGEGEVDGEGNYEYAYNPIGKRDPFRSFFRTVETGAMANPTPLQRFDIDQYKLVGIVWGISDPRAMVQDPESTGHVIEIGTYIGKNWGKVTQISSNAVVVTEEYQTIEGELVTNQITMSLPVDEAER